MMTQLVLRGVIVWCGFIQVASDKIFNWQVIDSIDEWLNLYNDYVNTLLRNVQKHGGGGQGGMISFKSEMNLRLTVFFV